MGEILDVAEALWKGEKDTYSYHPFGPPTGIEKIAHETWFYKGFANTVIRKTDDGLVIVDPSGFMDTQAKFDAVRSVVEPRLNTAIFTHGHVDHVFGVSNYIEFAQSKGWPRPKVVAHQLMLNRFQRYRETSTWNGIINGRQFLGKTSVYDETEFIVRNIWRLYGGWYDGTPSHLKPAPENDQAKEIVRRVYTTRAEAESSTMATGIYRSRAGEMEDD